MPERRLRPEEPCNCGSGLPYGACHKPIFDAPEGQQIAVGQTLYSQEWGVNAAHYEAQGLYGVLAAELVRAGDVRRVLDIGCGRGQGLRALRAAITGPERLIVGIDENAACLVAAARELGLDADHAALRRISTERQMNGYYESRAATAPLKLEGDLALINADLMIEDAALKTCLDSFGPFDAITMWFSGVHKARFLTTVAARMDATSDKDLREALEVKIMEAAVRHVRPGGLVQLVIRLAARDVDEARSKYERQMEEALAGKPFDAAGVTFHPYEECRSEHAVRLNASTLDLAGGENGALSILARARKLSTENATAGLFRLAETTPFNIAPERAKALANDVFGTHSWSLRRSGAGANFYAVVDDKAVYLSSQGLASLWCLARVVFTLIDLASRAARAPAARSSAEIDRSAEWSKLDLDLYLAYARRLIRTEAPWPLPLDAPDATAPSDSPEGRCNNLFFGALSWIVLHEIGHVHHGHGLLDTPHTRVRQEFQADQFATSWILDDAGNGLEREFRVLMIVTALAWLFLFEEANRQGPTHPATILRFREAAAQFGLHERSPAYENASYLLKALFDPANSTMPRRPTAREAFEWMAARLEDLFPVQ